MSRDHINRTLKLNPPITNIEQLCEYFLVNHSDELDEHLTRNGIGFNGTNVIQIGPTGNNIRFRTEGGPVVRTKATSKIPPPMTPPSVRDPIVRDPFVKATERLIIQIKNLFRKKDQ